MTALGIGLISGGILSFLGFILGMSMVGSKDAETAEWGTVFLSAGTWGSVLVVGLSTIYLIQTEHVENRQQCTEWLSSARQPADTVDVVRDAPKCLKYILEN